MAQEDFKQHSGISLPYGDGGQQQARGADGSGPQFTTNESGGATAGQAIGSADGVGVADGVSLPKLYNYVIKFNTIAQPSTNEGTVGELSAESVKSAVTTEPLALQVERSNIRFGKLLEQWSGCGRLFEFNIVTSGTATTGANVGCLVGTGTAANEWHIFFEDQPTWRSPVTDAVHVAEAAILESAAYVLESAHTETRHYIYDGSDGAHNNTSNNYSPDQPVTPIRKEVTAAALYASGATLAGVAVTQGANHP